MNTVLIASPSTFLRIALIQQLHRHRTSIACIEAADATEAIKAFVAGRIDLAIVDNALMAASSGERLIATIERRRAPALVIETRKPESTPARAVALRAISGNLDGTLDMGAIIRSLPAALDDVAMERGIHSTPSTAASAPVVHHRDAQRRRVRPEVMLVAASTGGPSALTLLLRHLGPPRLPMIVAQHMPADQTAGFARYLAAESGLDVIERGAGEVPSHAQVIVVRGGSDFRLGRGRAGQLRLFATEVAGNVFHPSADLLFGSAAEAGMAAIAVVLSGMGEDGARGAAALAARGDRVLVQDFASCVVAGMPSATLARCPSAVVAHVPEIAERLSRWSIAQTHVAAAIAEG